MDSHAYTTKNTHQNWLDSTSRIIVSKYATHNRVSINHFHDIINQLDEQSKTINNVIIHFAVSTKSNGYPWISQLYDRNLLRVILSFLHDSPEIPRAQKLATAYIKTHARKEKNEYYNDYRDTVTDKDALNKKEFIQLCMELLG
jgi:hypothetical protein